MDDFVNASWQKGLLMWYSDIRDLTICFYDRIIIIIITNKHVTYHLYFRYWADTKDVHGDTNIDWRPC